MLLKSTRIDTPIGPMLAIADDSSLYLLEFFSNQKLERQIQRFKHHGLMVIPGDAEPLTLISSELKAYFDGTLIAFQTPYRTWGSVFQKKTWQALCLIPYGETRSYKAQACAIGNPSGYRAVASANAANSLAIIIPCHRVIASDGTLGGYSAGLVVKEWLLAHEKHKINRL